ncbi:CHAD domain-containing protein [Pseudonocardia sp. GCM10023141]|uniref:CYTH and CHAD domain-containing protein n=1 Tax=Pseudonocardia sp. GCM10023141 TaxID=3252653 RepID=UPI0036070283
MPSTVRETERTYEPGEGGGLPSLTRVDGVEAMVGPDEIGLENQYFDTADLRLAAAGITLRHRRGGGETGWQLKLPAGGDSRDEIRVADVRTQRARLRPPPELVALTRAYSRGAVLTQVAVMTTQRREWRLLDGAGATVAELADDTVHGHRTGADTTAVTWREIEVELADAGDVALLDRVEKRLAKGGVRRSATATKLERVLGDRWPSPVAPPRISGASSVGAVVVAYLHTQAEQLRRMDAQVRRQAPDAVHQMRVAARRLRSALQAYGRVVDRDSTRELTDELKWLGEALGSARDLEVLHDHLQATVATLAPELVLGPVAAELTREFSPRQAAAAAEAVAALDSDRYLALLERIDLLLADPPLTRQAGRKARKAFPALLGRTHRSLGKRLRVAGSAAAGPERDEALHEARKAAKRLRYAGDVGRPALGTPGRRLTRQVKKLQQVLGDHHDAVAARPVVRDLAVRAQQDGGSGFTYGLLHEVESSRARDCERALPAAVRKVKKAAAPVLG